MSTPQPEKMPRELEVLKLEVDYAIPAGATEEEALSATADVLGKHYVSYQTPAGIRKLAQSFDVDTTSLTDVQALQALRAQPARTADIIGANAMIESRGLDRRLLSGSATFGEVLDIFDELRRKTDPGE